MRLAIAYQDTRATLHRRQAIHVALVGDTLACSIQWAVHATAVRLPQNTRRTLSIGIGAEAEADAIEAWRADSDGADRILVWPADQYLAWNALIEGLRAARPWQAGRARLLLRGSKGPEEARGDLAAGADAEPAAAAAAADPDEEDAPGTDAPGGRRPILALIPSLGQTSLLWAAAAMRLEPPFRALLPVALGIGYEVGEARDRLVQAALAATPPVDWVLFWGDDVCPPPTGLRRLVHIARTLDLPAVCGLYPWRSDPPSEWLLWRAGRPGLLDPGRDFQIGDLVEVDGAGIDFALIRTDPLAKVPQPRFKTLDLPDKAMSEDTWFWGRWRKATGRRPVVDSGVRCGHVDLRSGRVL